MRRFDSGCGLREFFANIQICPGGEMADTHPLRGCAARLAGSSPAPGTIDKMQTKCQHKNRRIQSTPSFHQSGFTPTISECVDCKLVMQETEFLQFEAVVELTNWQKWIPMFISGIALVVSVVGTWISWYK